MRKMGIGRSPMLAVAYLVTTGMSVEAALEQVKNSQHTNRRKSHERD